MTGLLHNMAFISMPGGSEWIVILMIGLLVFGRRLPEVARNLGKSVNEFKKGFREFQSTADEVARDVSKAANDATSDTHSVSDSNNYGYEEPGTATDYNTGHYDPAESTETSTETSEEVEPSESAAATSDNIEGGETTEVKETTAAVPDEQIPTSNT